MSDHRKLDHGPWLWMSKAAMERARSAGGPTALAVYTGICLLESNAPSRVKDCFHASARNLADASGVSTRTVEVYLPLLAKAGLFLLKSGRKAGPSGAHEANQFRLLNIGHPSAAASEASAFETRVNCGQKRTSPRMGERSSSEEKDNGSSAAASPAKAGVGAEPLKKQTAVGGFNRKGIK